jgi:hypothetical protein
VKRSISLPGSFTDIRIEKKTFPRGGPSTEKLGVSVDFRRFAAT